MIVVRPPQVLLAAPVMDMGSETPVTLTVRLAEVGVAELPTTGGALKEGRSVVVTLKGSITLTDVLLADVLFAEAVGAAEAVVVAFDEPFVA